MKESIINFFKKNKKKIIITIIILIVIILIATKNNSQETLNAEVETRTVVEDVNLSGTIQSVNQVVLGFADQGRVASVSVREGQFVKKGTVLASLDTQELEADLKNARASLAIAKNDAQNTTTSLASITQEQNIIVENAYRNLLSTDIQAIPDDISNNAQPPIISGKYTGPEGLYTLDIYASSANSGASFRFSGVENGIGTVSTSTLVPLGNYGLFIQFQEGESYVGTKWTISLPNTRSPQYVQLINAYQSAQATRERVITDARTSLAISNQQQSVAQARIAQAEASLERILAAINKRKIIAPFDGVVASVQIKTGQSTQGQESTITLVGQENYEVVLRVPEIHIGKLILGMPVTLNLDAYPDKKFTGSITSINPAESIIDGVPVYETKVLVDASDSVLKSGMTAFASIVIQKKENVTAIPFSSVQYGNSGNPFVSIVATDGKTEKRDITLGIRGSDGYIEVLTGISPGETIEIISQNR